MSTGHPGQLSPSSASLLIERIRDVFRHLPDARKGGSNQHYKLEDAALSAFSVPFAQSPSFYEPTVPGCEPSTRVAFQ